jgi:type IV pilus assembly protein PilE
LNKGFSLIELLFVLVITGILAIASYPSYKNYILRSHRVEGQTALLDLAHRMEHYFAEQNTYQTATIAQNKSSDILSTNYSPNGWYLLSIIKATQTAYTLQAALQRSQALQDSTCATLTFNHLGQKGSLPTIESSERKSKTQCW